MYLTFSLHKTQHMRIYTCTSFRCARKNKIPIDFFYSIDHIFDVLVSRSWSSISVREEKRSPLLQRSATNDSQTVIIWQNELSPTRALECGEAFFRQQDAETRKCYLRFDSCGKKNHHECNHTQVTRTPWKAKPKEQKQYKKHDTYNTVVTTKAHAHNSFFYKRKM